MRILGQIPHPDLSITVFKSGNKYLLKFEAGPFEQIYKFLETDQLNGFEAVQTMVNEKFIQDIYKVFDQMDFNYKTMVNKLTAN